MKKILLVALALMMLTLSIAAAEGEIKLGQVQYAAHGTKCFAVMTVAMQGDVIADAYIDEYQFMSKETNVGVPNSDVDFGTNFPEGQVLASKKVNAAAYSANMAKAGSTVALDANYALIEDYVTGKTVAEVEAAFAGKTAEEAIDVVAGCTLVDTLGYVNGLIEAAKAAK